MLQKHLNSIELKYGDDLIACGACQERPAVIHDAPELALPPDSKDKDKAKEKEADVMRTGPITLAQDGTVAGSVVIGGESTAADASMAPAQVAGGMAPEAVAVQAKQAYDIEDKDCQPVAYPVIEKFGAMLFLRMAEEKLLEAHLEALGVCTNKVAVSYVPKSDPIIWMARACNSFPADTLMLVPWASSLIQVTNEVEEESDAVPLKSIKRPKFLFSGLPLLATIMVECAEVDEALVFAARSPLAAKQDLNFAPSPFWCVLEAAEKEEEQKINMEVKVAKMNFDTVRMFQAGLPPKKKQKPNKMEFSFPVLVNSKPLKEDDILVVAHRSSFVLEELEDGEDEEAQATCCFWCILVLNVRRCFLARSPSWWLVPLKLMISCRIRLLRPHVLSTPCTHMF